MLVGPPASGKTTVRRRLLQQGLPSERVVSLDDLRRQLRDRAHEPRPLQDYTLIALRIASGQQRELVDSGAGYVSDATNLRRRERVAHVGGAGALPVIAVLMPDLPLGVLLARNAARPEDEQVPPDVLARFAHRRSLLTPELLLAEGFGFVAAPEDLVVPVP